MISAKVTTKGQITIPKEIRDYLKLKPGNRMLPIPRGGEVILCPVAQTLLNLRGRVKASGQPEDLDNVRRETKRVASRNLAQG